MSSAHPTRRSLLYAWLLATLFSGIPSTSYSLITGGDPLEATRAAGAMIGFPDSMAAAALVHACVSAFWAFVLWRWLPQRLAFWPQFADHLMWGACYSVGLSLARPRATRP
jgi:hypothetical protein